MKEEKNYKCPRCASILTIDLLPERDLQIEVDKCPACLGIWFDQGELQRIDQVVEPVLIEFRHIPSEYDQLTAMNCPKCAEHPLMEKHEHPRDEQVIIDVCPSCQGIWLDGGELAAIQQESFWKILLG